MISTTTPASTRTFRTTLWASGGNAPTRARRVQKALDSL
jgi:hypothetical protein